MPPVSLPEVQPPMSTSDPRRATLLAWLHQLPPELGLTADSLRPASSDASFRRYFRVDAQPSAPIIPGAGAASYIVMDAPPEHEDCVPFVRIARLFGEAGVTTPEVVVSDLSQGFLLLADLGDTTYAQALQTAAAEAPAIYGDALGALIRIQRASRPEVLPRYD